MVLRLAADGSDEAFAAGADNERTTKPFEFFHFANESEVVVDILAKADAGVEEDLGWVYAGGLGGFDAVEEERFHFFDDIVVAGIGLHG